MKKLKEAKQEKFEVMIEDIEAVAREVFGQAGYTVKNWGDGESLVVYDGTKSIFIIKFSAGVVTTDPDYIESDDVFISTNDKELESDFALAIEDYEDYIRRPGMFEKVQKEQRAKSQKLQEANIRKEKEKLNLLSCIVDFAYEYGENETKALFQQAFKKITGEDLSDALAD